MRTAQALISFLLILVFAACTSNTRENTGKDPVSYVDPFIGTDFFGHTFPGPAMPYSMVQLSPDHYNKGWTYCAGYSYSDSSIMGFSHTHFSGVGMLSGGDVLLMPTVSDKIQIFPGSRENPDSGYRSRYDKKDESAKAGYYSVLLKDYGVKAELSSTRRTGIHRYTFPASDRSNILIDLGHEIGPDDKSGISLIRIKGDREMEGLKVANNGVKIYFVAEFNKPFTYYGTWDADYQTPESAEGMWPYKYEEEGTNVGAFVSFKTKKDEQIMVKVALSHVSIEGARKNMNAEAPHWDFEAYVQNARDTWNQELSKIKIDGATDEQKTIFYTLLYHSFLAQFTGQDVDGQYMGMDRKVHTTDHNFYPSFSVWDTYRSQHPLLTLTAPEEVNAMIKSIILKAKEYEWLPAQHFRNVFEPDHSMVGDHLIPVVVDAYQKGFKDYDVEFLYQAIRRKAMEVPPPSIPLNAGRSGLPYYIDLGYTPVDRVNESVPNTLELAYDDWCIAELAKALGKEDDAAMFYQRAHNYKNLYDAETRFMRPRKLNGEWLEALVDKEQEIVKAGDHQYYRYFDPLLVGRRPNRHYTESNAWQYLWSVQHDPAGLINLLGGDDAFSARLDAFFTMSPGISPPKYVGVVGNIGQYVHGNQPSHHVAYLYNYARKPYKTQEKVREVMERFYRSGPGGLCGNEDMGSLSSWFILSSMGIYPVTPGMPVYAIGSPLFGSAELVVADGKTFRFVAENNSSENKYIQSATLNGEVFDRSWIHHNEIWKGGELTFVMGPEPNVNWATGKDSVPFSMSNK